MCDNPLISIIVPIYNREMYLESCVESILNQTEKNIEVILVDDGSTDDSLKICTFFAEKDNRVKVIHKENAGVGSARNAGMKIARGKWIAFVDSDDVVSNSCYSEMLRWAEKNKTCMCICGACYMTENEVIPIKCEKTEEIIEYTTSHRLINKLWESQYDNFLFTSPVNKLFLKSYFREKLHFREGIICEDDNLANRLYLDNYSIVIVHKPLYYWRMTPGSIGHSSFSQKNCIMLEILGERVEIFEKNGFTMKAQETAKIFCELYIEYYCKALALKHIEWVEKYNSDFKKNKKKIGNIKIKTRVRYAIFYIFPKFYMEKILKL